jgi:Bacterial Ig-like domain
MDIDADTLKNWRTIEVITSESSTARYEREAPYVSYTQPYDDAKNVPVSTKRIVAMFNESMNTQTFVDYKFTLRFHVQYGSYFLYSPFTCQIGLDLALNFHLRDSGTTSGYTDPSDDPAGST